MKICCSETSEPLGLHSNYITDTIEVNMYVTVLESSLPKRRQTNKLQITSSIYYSPVSRELLIRDTLCSQKIFKCELNNLQQHFFRQ